MTYLTSHGALGVLNRIVVFLTLQIQVARDVGNPLNPPVILSFSTQFPANPIPFIVNKVNSHVA